MKKFEYESNASSVRYNKTRGKISPSLSLSPLRGEILKRARPIIRRKRLIYRDRRKKKKKRFPNPMAGVLRGTRRGEGLIGIPFLLLGDSEGKRRVDLEASLSTRSLTVYKVCQTGEEEAGREGGGTCEHRHLFFFLLSPVFLLSVAQFFFLLFSIRRKDRRREKNKKTRVSIYKFCLRNRRLYLKKKRRTSFLRTKFLEEEEKSYEISPSSSKFPSTLSPPLSR